MGQVGEAAAHGATVGPNVRGRLRLVSAAAPLQPEPFLVEAAIAEKAGELSRAELLLKQARWRDPRSAAARYLLADVWLRENRIVDGLGEMAVLARLLPGASVQLVPALAAYARTPGADQQLIAILRANPQLRRPLLIALAGDPQNVALVVKLSGVDERSSDPGSLVWKSRLLNALIERGDYQRAYGLWRNFAGLAPGGSPLLFNGEFKKLAVPPPFNWSYNSGKAGIAEPANERLRVLYYGRDNQTFAAQLLLLKPGNYRFEAPVRGKSSPDSLYWTLTCGSDGTPIMQLSITSTPSAARFAVPAGCETQSLKLNGHEQDMPQDSDVQIGPVRIERVGP